MLAVTVTSLVLQARAVVDARLWSMPWLNGLVSVILLALAGTLIAYAARAMRRPGAAV